MGFIKLGTKVMVLAKHVVDVCRLAVDMHVLAAHVLDQIGGGPHANAPRVASVVARDDLVGPHPLSLPRDLPKVLVAPEQGLLRVSVDQLRADSMSLVMVALVVTVAGTLTRADSYLSCLQC